MNKLFKSALVLAVAALALGTTSCKKKGCTDETATNFDEKAKKDDGTCEYPAGLEDGSSLPSTVAAGETVTLAEGNSYFLNEALTVEDGGVLEIEAGVTITAKDGTPASMFIAIERGGKIEANGTSTSPIVFTAADENPGAWGGISIAGKATCNTGVDQEAEISGLLYGGTEDSDNSGTLRYVRVEYSGAQINDDKQFNGFSFYGVGSGTTLEYIESYKGQDDGIEFFGGTANISYAVSIGSGDDSFDFAEGWTGEAKYIYIEHLEGMVQDKGIEGDNLKADNSATPVSNPTISNVTIKSVASVLNADGESVDGIRIREGAKGTFTNILIENLGDDGIDARSLATLENINDGSLSFSNVTVTNAGDKDVDAKIDDGETDSGTVVDDAKAALGNAIGTSATGADYDSWKGSWTK